MILIPPRLVPVARELGLAFLDGRIWRASEEGLEAIRAESKLRASAAKDARKEARRLSRLDREASREARGAAVEDLRAGWRILCEEGSEEEREAWLDEKAEILDSSLGRIAFGLEPIASTAVFFAVLMALRGLREGKIASVSIQIAARRYKVEPRAVAAIVGRVGGRRLSERKRGATIGVKRGNSWRDVDKTPEQISACAQGNPPAKVGQISTGR